MEQKLDKAQMWHDKVPIIISNLECKICKMPLPCGDIVFTTCCCQIVGCKSCLQTALDESGVCPLCRAEDPEIHMVSRACKPL